MSKRFVLPTALVALAAALGVFVVGGPTAGASSPAAGTPRLAGAAMQPSDVQAGETLFVQNCSSCHGIRAEGSGRAPNLQGVGAATVDLWLSAGWMPLAEPTSQPEDKPPRFPPDQIRQIVDYVTSLAPGGVPIPSVDLTNANVATGFDLFALNCAGCHTITGAGDMLAGLVRAPSLHGIAPTQVAEAIMTGPGNMPRFSSAVLSPQQVNDVVAYVVHYLQTPTDPGGLSLGGVGPVAEGFVGLFGGVGACMLIALWIGDRTEREEEEHKGDEHASGGEAAEGAHA
jgi:ubiquinol-cytochrome c reductase cytochrome c subunit